MIQLVFFFFLIFQFVSPAGQMDCIGVMDGPLSSGPPLHPSIEFCFGPQRSDTETKQRGSWLGGTGGGPGFPWSRDGFGAYDDILAVAGGKGSDNGRKMKLERFGLEIKTCFFPTWITRQGKRIPREAKPSLILRGFRDPI